MCVIYIDTYTNDHHCRLAQDVKGGSVAELPSKAPQAALSAPTASQTLGETTI